MSWKGPGWKSWEGDWDVLIELKKGQTTYMASQSKGLYFLFEAPQSDFPQLRIGCSEEAAGCSLQEWAHKQVYTDLELIEIAALEEE